MSKKWRHLQIYKNKGLPEKAINTSKHVHASEPSCCVRSSRSDASGRYRSQKMRFLIELESRELELSSIYQIQHDDHASDDHAPLRRKRGNAQESISP